MIGPLEFLALPLLFVFVVLPIWGILDAATRSEPAWRAAGHNKLAWIIVQVFLGGIGAVAYFAAIRPKLKQVA